MREGPFYKNCFGLNQSDSLLCFALNQSDSFKHPNPHTYRHISLKLRLGNLIIHGKLKSETICC